MTTAIRSLPNDLLLEGEMLEQERAYMPGVPVVYVRYCPWCNWHHQHPPLIKESLAIPWVCRCGWLCREKVYDRMQVREAVHD